MPAADLTHMSTASSAEDLTPLPVASEGSIPHATPKGTMPSAASEDSTSPVAPEGSIPHATPKGSMPPAASEVSLPCLGSLLRHGSLSCEGFSPRYSSLLIMAPHLIMVPCFIMVPRLISKCLRCNLRCPHHLGAL